MRTVGALAVLPNGSVLVGTGQGIFRWRSSHRDWEQLFGRSGRTRVSSLVVDGAGRLIAGTNAGVFVSEDGGDTWISANLGLPALGIRALAVAADGNIYAAVGPQDWQAYATGRYPNAGVRGIFRGRFANPRGARIEKWPAPDGPGARPTESPRPSARTRRADRCRRRDR